MKNDIFDLKYLINVERTVPQSKKLETSKISNLTNPLIMLNDEKNSNKSVASDSEFNYNNTQLIMSINNKKKLLEIIEKNQTKEQFPQTEHDEHNNLDIENKDQTYNENDNGHYDENRCENSNENQDCNYDENHDGNYCENYD